MILSQRRVADRDLGREGVCEYNARKGFPGMSKITNISYGTVTHKHQ